MNCFIELKFFDLAKFGCNAAYTLHWRRISDKETKYHVLIPQEGK